MVASPQAAFSQILLRSLADSGQYEVCLEPDLRSAAARAAVPGVDLVVLDAEKAAQEDLAAWRALFLRRPTLPVVLFPPDNNPQHFFLEGISFSAVWVKPFLMVDFMAVVDALLEAPEPQQSDTARVERAGNGWFPEEVDAAFWLKDLVANSAVRAGFVLQENRLRTAAGSLDAVANHEIATLLVRSWKGGRSADLLRYIHLAASAEDVLVYATAMDHDQILGLVFSEDTPINQARLLTRLAAQELTPRRSADSPKSPLSPDFSRAGDEASEDGEVKIEDLNLSQIFAELPGDTPSIPLIPTDSGWQSGEGQGTEVEETDTFAWWIEPSQIEQAADPGVGSLEKLQPYGIILHPENPATRLEGPLADFLQNWIPRFCVDNGVQLDELAAFKQVMACKMRLPAAGLPGSLARKLRQESSLLIQEKFPELFVNIQPEEFWSADILIVNSSEMPPLPVIEDFIQHNRPSPEK